MGQSIIRSITQVQKADDIPAQDTGMRWMFVFSGFGGEADEGRE